MANDDPDERKLEELEKKLREAKRSSDGTSPERVPPSNLGIAFRLSTEFVAAVVVGGGIGWALDRVFGTSPFLLIVMFFLGTGAGFLNVIRAARELNENAGNGDKR